MRQWRNVQLNRPITLCIAQFNLYLVVLVVAISPITRPAIASHNLALCNPGISGLSLLNPGIPGLAKRSGIAFPKCNIYIKNWTMCCVCIVLPAWGLVSRFSGLLLCPRCVGEVRHNKISGITNVTISCIMYAPQLLRILLHEFMLWFTLLNAKAKLTVSMPIGRLSATVWGREHKHKKVQRKTAKKMVSDCCLRPKTTHTCLLPNAVST